MTESTAIARSTHGPVTTERLVEDLRALGVRPGMTIMVHTGLSRIGWVCGGAHSVISALITAIGPEGTLMMPAQSPSLSDPQHWENPPVPQSWWPTIRASQPPYDPALTPTYQCGIVAETFRHWPETQRSTHPLLSLCARGANAQELLKDQPLDDPLGNQSPLAALENKGGFILMIGSGWETCTALHLAERRAEPNGPTIQEGAPMLINGQRQWVPITLPLMDSARFVTIGAQLDGTPFMTHGHIGHAFSRFFPLRPASHITETALRVTSRPPT
ncbi:aminoglycoside N(3)-acetyltransferase [Neokomagataea thailandica]|nr:MULTISPECIES: AAC(3) family N-acetyltransferase [Neokomagataea]